MTVPHSLDRALKGPDGAALMDELTAIVAEAAAVIRATKSAGAAARMKADRSPVTAADETAEALILDRLARLLPDVPVVSEEAVARGARPQLGRSFMLVDPLDGTREFLAGLDEFTVNIAVVVDGSPVAGVIAAPALGCVWRGIIGRGAERLDLAPEAAPKPAHAATAIRPRRAPAHGVIAAISRSHLDDRTEAFVAALPAVERLTCGSSLKFCRVAEGSADVYPRLAPTREWDVAAGHAILTASGGTMTAPGGDAVVYGRAADSFLVPGFVAWGDPDAAKRFRAPAP